MSDMRKPQGPARPAGQHLAVYLNDHLAGSVVALELLAGLERARAGTDLERFAADLRADIDADRQELEALMARLGVTVSSPRKAAAWLAEKATEMKLHLDDPAGGSLRLLETLEAVAIGIHGKQALWRALAAVAESHVPLQGHDYEHLQKRAEEQRGRVEKVRLEAARAALSVPAA